MDTVRSTSRSSSRVFVEKPGHDVADKEDVSVQPPLRAVRAPQQGVYPEGSRRAIAICVVALVVSIVAVMAAIIYILVSEDAGVSLPGAPRHRADQRNVYVLVYHPRSVWRMYYMRRRSGNEVYCTCHVLPRSAVIGCSLRLQRNAHRLSDSAYTCGEAAAV
ncbi:uncharacterized protein LOC144133683 [Amblyomma americanum]